MIFPLLDFLWPSKKFLVFFQFSWPSHVLIIQNHSILSYFEAILSLKQFCWRGVLNSIPRGIGKWKNGRTSGFPLAFIPLLVRYLKSKYSPFPPIKTSSWSEILTAQPWVNPFGICVEPNFQTLLPGGKYSKVSDSWALYPPPNIYKPFGMETVTPLNLICIKLLWNDQDFVWVLSL